MNPPVDCEPVDASGTEAAVDAESVAPASSHDMIATAAAEPAAAPDVHAYEPDLGQRLRAARETRAWSVTDAAVRLHLPTTVVQALESGNYARIGNGIYLRGYMLSYLRLLALPASLLETLVEPAQTEPPLVTTGAISHPRYLYNRYSVPTIYLILTGLIVVPAVWLTTHGGLEQTLVRIAPLDTPAENSALNTLVDSNTPAIQSPGEQPAPSGLNPLALPGGTTSTANATSTDAPLIASFTPVLNPVQTASPATPAIVAAKESGAHHVRLSLTEESWVEILGTEGKRLDYGLLPAGTQHEYYSDGALDIRIGNSNGATLEVDGHAMDLAPYRHSNVARLRLFSESDKASHSDS
ncbi:helix-turn-helix domain-containing protein [Pseudolysobacter antarcticus]|nr:helix-turn-helix domain-containing protein [Pseudolysobacter antarcticus]